MRVETDKKMPCGGRDQWALIAIEPVHAQLIKEIEKIPCKFPC